MRRPVHFRKLSKCGNAVKDKTQVITDQLVATLRARVAEQDQSPRGLENLIVAVENYVSFVLKPSVTLANPICDNSGHVIKSDWQAGLPTCADCGSAIHNPGELRTVDVRM